MKTPPFDATIVRGPQGIPARTPSSPMAPEPTTPPSLIETLRVEAGGEMPLLIRHLDRLHRSCQALGYPWPGDTVIKNQLTTRLSELDPAHAWRLRLLLAPDGQLTLEDGRLTPLPLPLNVVVAGPRASGATQWLEHKTTHRPWYQDATQWLADHPNVFDVLYWNERGEMCEGSRSNLYMQAADGRWLTPPLESGALPGVQRGALLQAGLVVEAPIQRDDFLRAPAWRISNALRGWQDAKAAAF